MGLKNVGNTCYVNSLLQAYFYLDFFRDTILSFQDNAPPSWHNFLSLPSASSSSSSASASSSAAVSVLDPSNSVGDMYRIIKGFFSK